MKQIIKQDYKEENKRRVAIWRLEVDYELATLYEAMQEKNYSQIDMSKKKLERLRKEWERIKK